MQAPGFDPRYEPAAVKAALPVEWVLGQLFGVWGAGHGEMIPCPLPEHPDRTPSFNLWAPDEEGIPMRWGCFGCAETGDVIDLIKESQHVGFTDACTYAVDVLLPLFSATDWQPSDGQQSARYEADPEVLLRAFYALDPWPEHIERFHREKVPDVPLEWIVEEFGWRGAYVGMPVAVFPHYDWSGDLRGIRYRSIRRGNRWTEKGSRFEALYGGFLDCGFERVLLTEGETDTVSAAWQLHRHPVEVFGLASGAAQRPPESAVDRLANRHVWLAFDGDMAGRIATNRWLPALEEAGCVVNVCPVPDGHDVRSCGIPILDLMKGGPTE